MIRVMSADEKYSAKIIAIGLVCLLCLVEAAIVLWAFSRADKVSCNWLWCEFTTVVRNATISKTCYENGVLVNCSEVIR